MGFKIMKKLSQPTNFRYAAVSTRRVEVGIPQASGVVYVRRRSMRTLRAYLDRLDRGDESEGGDEGVEDEDENGYDYPFWLAQCVHYGLEFPATSLDARQIFRSAIAGGLRKEPWHLRQLAKALKEKRTEREHDEGSIEGDEMDLVLDQDLEPCPDVRQEEPPLKQPQRTSNISVVIPLRSSSAPSSGPTVTPQSTKSIWDLPSDDEDDNREARGETYFDTALAEHVNNLYNEAEFDKFGEFENEYTASEMTPMSRSSIRVTTSSALRSSGESSARKRQLPSSPTPGLLSEIDRKLAAAQKRGKAKSKKRAKENPTTGNSSSFGHDAQHSVAATTIPTAKPTEPTRLKRKAKQSRVDSHIQLEASRSKRPSIEPHSTIGLPQELTNIVDSIEHNQPFPGIDTSTGTPSSAASDMSVNGHRHTKSLAMPSSLPEVHVISSDSDPDSGYERASEDHTFTLALRTTTPSGSRPPDATAAPSSTSAKVVQESHLVSLKSSGELTSSLQEPSDNEDAEEEEDQIDGVEDLKRRQEKWAGNLRRLEEEIEARRLELEEKERWGETIRDWQKASEVRMVREKEKAAMREQAVMSQSSTVEKEVASQKEKKPRKSSKATSKKRARSNSPPKQDENSDKMTTPTSSHRSSLEGGSERPKKMARSTKSVETEKQEAGASQSPVKKVPTPKAKKGQSMDDGSSQKSATTDTGLTSDEKAKNRGAKSSQTTKSSGKKSPDSSQDQSAISRPTADKAGSKNPGLDGKALSNKSNHRKEAPTTKQSPPGKQEQEWRRITYTSNPMAGRRPGSYRLDSVAPIHFRDIMTIEVPIPGPGQKPEDLPPSRMVPNPDHGDNPPLELQWVEQHRQRKKKMLDDFMKKIPEGSRFEGLEARVVSDARGMRVEW